MNSSALTFAILTATCGLSQREAADVLGVRIDTVKSWSAGRNQPRESVLKELADLYARIERSATESLALIKDEVARRGGDPEVIELGAAASDEDARALGWPCVGAHLASIGLIVARGMASGLKFNVRPRMSTAALRAAALAHGKTN